MNGLKSFKSILIVVSIILIGIYFLFYGVLFKKEHKYKKSDMSITMASGLKEREVELHSYWFESDELIVTIEKQDFSQLTEKGYSTDMSTEEFLYLTADEYMYDKENVNVINSSSGDYSYFNYKLKIFGELRFKTLVGVKGSDGYWVFSFICKDSQSSEYKDKFLKWADSIEVK